MAWTTATTRATGFTVTAAVWNAEVVDNMLHLEEVGYTAFTSPVSITATTEGTANQIVSSGAISYEAVPHMIEFHAPNARPDNAAANRSINFVLEDSTTVIATIGRILTPAASNNTVPVFCGYRITPTAASHTYNVRAWVNAGTGNVGAGASGTTTDGPGYIRIWKVVT